MKFKRGNCNLSSAFALNFYPKSKRSQVTIFIIIAIIIVSLIGIFFVFRGKIIPEKIPISINPVYNSFLNCLEGYSSEGINVLESQGGYIYLPDFEPGSAYSPFSSQLNFLGNPIPYWYYLSGNNLLKEQVPSQAEMEQQLGRFIEEKINECVLDNYYEQGFEIIKGEPKAEVNIKGNKVEVRLNMDMTISKGDESVFIKQHNIAVDSSLGNLYDSARKVYEYEQKNLFLENYGIDILRLYAPVDGVELTCGPKIWNADEIFADLKKAIQENVLTLETGLSKNYFSVNTPISEKVRFINSEKWPSTFEVYPSEGNSLISNPVGNQQGLGILGFCYVPYHFTYNAKYPVLIQVAKGMEIFQFPVAVVIEGNKPRKPVNASATEIAAPELCRYKNNLMKISVYDSSMNPIDADISYECLGEKCNIGKTSAGILNEKFPQCVNGFVLAKADGFSDGKYLFSSINEGSVDIILSRSYTLNVDLNVDGQSYNGNAIISFSSGSLSKSIVYPSQKTLDLSDGQYNIQVFIYKNSSLKIDESVYQQCVNIPNSGLGGLLGITQKKCFDVKVPSQIISPVLSGGGKQDYYILENDLKSARTIEINAESLPVPNSIEQLQNNYILFENKGLNIELK